MSNEVKWTPGPWVTSQESARIIKKDYSEIGSTRGPLIASTMGHDKSAMYASEIEADANAQLIVVAPDLYEALDWAMKFVDQVRAETSEPDGFVSDGERIAYKRARAALAKARGEQQ